MKFRLHAGPIICDSCPLALEYYNVVESGLTILVHPRNSDCPRNGQQFEPPQFELTPIIGREQEK